MIEQQIRSILRNLVEQKAPAAKIDLWPAIETQLQTSDLIPLRGTPMNTRQPLIQRLRYAALIVLAVLLCGLFIFATPQGQALGQNIMHFFNRGASNLMPGVTVTPVQWVEQTPGIAAATLTPQPPQPTPPGPAFETACGSYNAPHCTIEAIRKMASFPVFALAKLPEGMRFSGATGGPDQIYLTYETSNQTGFLMIWEEPYTGAASQQAWEVGASADIQSVKVAEVTAEYVKGSYNGNSNPPVWNPDADLQMLRWVNQGILFNLTMSGTEPRLGRDELAALGSTLTDGPLGEAGSVVASTATPAPTDAPIDPNTVLPLTLEQVKEKAGFAPLSPARLPETLIYKGAFYDDQSKMVWLSYQYDNPNFPDNTDGLVLYEETISKSGVCQLCGFVVSQYTGSATSTSLGMVGTDAAVETVLIGNVKGEYVEGVWNGTDQGWIWVSDPYVKTLRWQRNGMAFELKYFGLAITKEDMVAIAQSIQ